MKRIKKLITKPWLLVSYFRFTPLTNWLPDKFYLSCMYKSSLQTKLNWKKPEGYTDKLQWLKLYDHRPEYTAMVDKLEAKQWVAGRIGSEYIIPILGVWSRPADIDFDELPEQFVLKCNHDSAGLVICTDKNDLDESAARQKLSACLKRNFYYSGREWPYKNVKPRIIAEKYMEDEQDKELRDYKFFTFGGVPKLLYITQGRGKNCETTADFFDMDFNHLDIRMDHEMAEIPPHKPQNFELMKELAAKLSKGTPQLRVDFYEVNGKVYFGELTFFHCSGFSKITPPEWDEILGSWIELPPKTV